MFFPHALIWLHLILKQVHLELCMKLITLPHWVVLLDGVFYSKHIIHAWLILTHNKSLHHSGVHLNPVASRACYNLLNLIFVLAATVYLFLG